MDDFHESGNGRRISWLRVVEIVRTRVPRSAQPRRPLARGQAVVLAGSGVWLRSAVRARERTFREARFPATPERRFAASLFARFAGGVFTGDVVYASADRGRVKRC